MQEIIKEYLDELAKKDECLAAKYNPEQIESCCEYITDMAREYLDSKNGMIPDETVYKWARDFFVEGQAEVKARLEKELEEKRAKEEEERHIKAEEERKRKEEEKEKLAKEKAEKEFQEKQHKDGQLSLLDLC